MVWNPYKALRALLPDPPLQVGTVTAVDDGTATIALPGGGSVQGRGAATVGQHVFVRDGVIEGEAPALTTVLIDV